MSNEVSLISLKGKELSEAIEAARNKVLAAADIVEVISSATPNVEIMSDGNFCCSCCFHDQTNPSVVINPEKQWFDCYGCGARGNVLDYVFFSLAKKNDTLKGMLPSQIIEYRDKSVKSLSENQKAEVLKVKSEVKRLYEKSYALLAQRLEEINGMPMFTAEEKFLLDYKKNRQYEIMREAANFYYKILRDEEQGALAMKYCAERGFTRTTLDEAGIGYAPGDAYYKLGKHLKNCGFSEMELEGAGVIKAVNKTLKDGSESSRAYDVFIDRVIIPIKDAQGRVVGLGGRLVSADTNYAKYINTASKSEVYQKREILYNFDIASKTPVKDGEVILCEGMLDCISAKQGFYANCVASCGTALTDEHADLLSRNFKKVIIAYDNDAAGNKAFERAKEMLESRGMEVYRVDLSPFNVKDFNELLKKQGEQSFAKLFASQNIPTYNVNSVKIVGFGKNNAIALRDELKKKNVPCRVAANANGDVMITYPDICKNIVDKSVNTFSAEKVQQNTHVNRYSASLKL